MQYFVCGYPADEQAGSEVDTKLGAKVTMLEYKGYIEPGVFIWGYIYWL
jgi:hypothetical protein